MTQALLPLGVRALVIVPCGNIIGNHEHGNIRYRSLPRYQPGSEGLGAAPTVRQDLLPEGQA